MYEKKESIKRQRNILILLLNDRSLKLSNRKCIYAKQYTTITNEDRETH